MPVSRSIILTGQRRPCSDFSHVTVPYILSFHHLFIIINHSCMCVNCLSSVSITCDRLRGDS